ncbi:MAG: ATP-binding cassette domain-containing protein, partial [Acidimicrobiales bacterium]
SELAQLLAGALTPTGGSITHGGGRRRLRSRTDHTRHGVAFLPADRKRQGLLVEQTVADNILLSRLSLPGELVTKFRRNHRRAEATVRRLAIKTRSVDAPISVLSGGNQQKAILGRWLEVGSTLLVFDEPTSGVDINSKMELYRRLIEVAGGGAAVVFVSSYYEEISALADRVLLMRDGQVIGEVSGEEADGDRLVRMEIGA